MWLTGPTLKKLIDVCYRVKRKTWLIAVAVATLISVGLATFVLLTSERADVRVAAEFELRSYMSTAICRWWADACGDVCLGQLDRG